ncbi:protein retinal degeneration B isoform X2 [Folsomia candida]|uniref:protein retinal degeneration B isoform X2 n=1 Tax=Folsomia candida TaxID=158441 RepID=UPI001604C806|nr:protein retinal degeneration B isoform X2 [Folsomia candida]
MLIKEYRIPLPLTVEEYRIAQLYMIAKKSRDESKGVGNGVEILLNEPYEDGPGPAGTGQYTRKMYHVGSHLPGWFKSLLPKSALTVEEEAWNAYPYTKTRYTCPFVQRFSLEIETYYCADAGHQDNVFGVSESDVRNPIVDLIDVVKDQLHGTDYVKEEDPKFYRSQKTSRGPLDDNWIDDYWQECQGKNMPLSSGKAIMCAYKLCRVEFHYWGMQSKIEKFIHDYGLRRIMLRAHRQAWAWQDEWYGMTMSDIRELERQTQEALRKKMANSRRDAGEEDDGEDYDHEDSRESVKESPFICTKPSSDSSCDDKKSDNSSRSWAGDKGGGGAGEYYETSRPKSPKITVKISDLGDNIVSTPSTSKSISCSGKGHHSSPRAAKKVEASRTWRVEGLMKNESDSEGSDDEFFDCLDGDDSVSLTKWSSLDLIPQGEAKSDYKKDDSIFSQPFLQRVTTGREKHKVLVSRGSMEASLPGSPTIYGGNAVLASSCSTTVLCMVLHAGSALDATVDLPAKKSDVTTFKGAFESVIRQHYPSMMGHVVVKLVPCPSVCTDALAILSSLSPYSFDVYGTGDSPQMTHESVPIGAIPLVSTCQLEYLDAVSKTVVAANQVYTDFLKCEEGQGFSGQIVFIGDSMGSILGYDALVKHCCAGQFLNEDEVPPSPDHLLQCPSGETRRRSSSSASDSSNTKLDFEVSDFFMFGSPLGLVLAHRRIQCEDRHMPWTRPCQQVYNLFHPTDPLAARLEPLISARFAGVPPVNVARYTKYPLGDGLPFHLLESIQSNPHLFAESGVSFGALASSCGRRLSDISIQSGMSGLTDALSLQAINQLTQKWWGNKRIDYALYCPEALASFPLHSLPHLFHASYWESTDAIAFILRQIGFQESSSLLSQDEKEVRVFTPNQPREKWVKKRTSVKLKNVAANHRANDVIVGEGHPQALRARFMYGPLDMVTLTGEKVDIYIMKDPPMGEWSQLATEVTDKNGRIYYSIPSDKAFGYGIYPVKMVVRGDHTCVDFYCAVVPPKTECVVFSIDGSFTASVSVTGRDPRVRAGAVDVVRHWQELGYLIIYVTGRPDMQQHKVVSWLAQHNFPHGLVSFADGLSTDFLGHKADYLRSLVQDQKLVIHAAYGSSKDIGVYACASVSSDRIFIVGKASKKQHSMATVLSDGYSAHLNALQAHGGSRPAHGNARMVIPRGYFGLPGQPLARRRRSAKRTTSYPVMGTPSESSLTLMTPTTGRGASPRRPKASLSTFPN